MAIGIYFSPASLNETKYNEAMKRLAAAGAGSPKGRSYHVCFGSGDQLKVFEVWNSQADFDAFGPTLMPILAAIGIDPGQPMVELVQNIVNH